MPRINTNRSTDGKGPAVDASGNPVVDPTENVRSLVEAGLRRQDDLRTMESAHIRDLLSLQERYDDKLSIAEAKRIDAIRQVDVAAVAQAAKVSADQAATLATQVAVSAETLRTQVATVATASATSLASALSPLVKAIEELRAAQYQQQGQQVQRTEGKDTNQWIIGLLVAIGGVMIAMAGVAITWIVSHK